MSQKVESVGWGYGSGIRTTTAFNLADVRVHTVVLGNETLHFWRITSAGLGGMAGFLVALVILAVGYKEGTTQAGDIIGVLLVFGILGAMFGAINMPDVEVAEMRRTAMREREGSATIWKLLWCYAFGQRYGVVREEDWPEFVSMLKDTGGARRE